MQLDQLVRKLRKLQRAGYGGLDLGADGDALLGAVVATAKAHHKATGKATATVAQVLDEAKASRAKWGY